MTGKKFYIVPNRRTVTSEMSKQQLLSVCLLASSVPLLALAYENKRKAKSLLFTASSLSIDLPNGNKQEQPAFGFCLNFWYEHAVMNTIEAKCVAQYIRLRELMKLSALAYEAVCIFVRRKLTFWLDFQVWA